MGYYIPYLKAIEATNGLTCPGELYCLSKTPEDADIDPEVKDKLEAVKICSGLGTIQGRTLKNYCHSEKPTKENGLITGCPLYATKPEHMTPTLQVAIESAEYFRELKELGLLPKLEDMTCYEFECYKFAERAVRKVQNDKAKEMEEESKNKSSNKIGQGDQSAINW